MAGFASVLCGSRPSRYGGCCTVGLGAFGARRPPVDFRHDCPMYSSALPSADALIARIDRCIRQAAEAAELVARHEALYAVAQTLKSEILEFASKEPDDEAVMRCVQALHEQVAAFKAPGARMLVGFDHPNYGHMATTPEPVRTALSEDFD